MNQIFNLLNPPSEKLFFCKNDVNDIRLGECVSREIKDYESSEIVILGCPQDEGVRRNGGRTGAALAPEAVRKQFYKLTNYGITAKILDLGDVKIGADLEETHQIHTQIVQRLLADDKKIIVIGGGNDISYADGAAVSNVFGAQNWSAFNIDAHLDVRFDQPRNSGTPYFQLLDEKLLLPENFHEIGFHLHAVSPVYLNFLENLNVNLINFEEICTLRQKGKSPDEVIFERFFKNKKLQNVFWGIDLDVVRACDAPGVSAPNAIGFFAEELLDLVKTAAQLKETRVIEFSEINPKFDIDERTARLTAAALHCFCRNIKQ